MFCLHIGFSHPGNQFRAVITSIINILQSYGAGGGGGEGGRGGGEVSPGKRQIVVQCNNLFNKTIISYSEAEGNQRNIEHAVKMFRLLTKNIL